MDKLALCRVEGITLDGKKAVISGVRNEFATVTQAGTGISFQWSWSAVHHVIANRGGAFKS